MSDFSFLFPTAAAVSLREDLGWETWTQLRDLLRALPEAGLDGFVPFVPCRDQEESTDLCGLGPAPGSFLGLV